MAAKKKAKKGARKLTPTKKGRVAAKPAARKAAAPRRATAPKKKPRAAARKAGKTTKAAKRARVAARAKASAAAGAKSIHRRDATGHLDPKYAAELRALSSRDADPSSFVARPRSTDDLVEELGEEFVSQATSAEHEGEDLLDQEVPEERGGPFVETSGDQEFAVGTDPSNPKDATREPFPRT